MDRYTGLTSVGETGNDNEQQPSKQLEDSMSSDGGGKLRAAGTASHHGALEESSKGSGSEQDDASSEMHGDEYGEEDSTVGVGVAEQQAAGPSHPVVMPGDRLAVLKKQKRLAMNRESARNRRKRKKILLETLQKQNDELTRTNRTLLLSKAALASKIQALEQELSIARTTIAQYRMGGGSTSVVAGMPTHGGVGLGQSLPTGTQNIQRGDALDQQLRSQTTDPLGTSDNLSRLMQAQLEHLALQRQQANALDPTGSASFHQQAGLGTTGFPFHRHLSQPAFTNEALLRRHGLELKALSQAARDSALGSLMSRQQTNDVFNQQDREASERSLASSGLSQSTGMRADIDQLLSQQLNPVMLDQRGGLQGSAGPASSQANAGLRLPDTRLHQLETSQDDIAANRQQKILRELLRQRHSGGSWDNKPPPDDRPDPSL